ncbi:hypothetical protein K438DRAFT_1981240 [Mycena galopus ATCC 62051]|nr:hypothetical protein K438DRAFT_1981240 [Mycena galopus ATCC 62051]
MITIQYGRAWTPTRNAISARRNAVTAIAVAISITNDTSQAEFDPLRFLEAEAVLCPKVDTVHYPPLRPDPILPETTRHLPLTLLGFLVLPTLISTASCRTLPLDPHTSSSRASQQLLHGIHKPTSCRAGMNERYHSALPTAHFPDSIQSPRDHFSMHPNESLAARKPHNLLFIHLPAITYPSPSPASASSKLFLVSWSIRDAQAYPTLSP